MVFSKLKDAKFEIEAIAVIGDMQDKWKFLSPERIFAQLLNERLDIREETTYQIFQ